MISRMLMELLNNICKGTDSCSFFLPHFPPLEGPLQAFLDPFPWWWFCGAVCAAICVMQGGILHGVVRMMMRGEEGDDDEGNHSFLFELVFSHSWLDYSLLFSFRLQQLIPSVISPPDYTSNQSIQFHSFLFIPSFLFPSIPTILCYYIGKILYKFNKSVDDVILFPLEMKGYTHSNRCWQDFFFWLRENPPSKQRTFLVLYSSLPSVHKLMSEWNFLHSPHLPLSHPFCESQWNF